MNHEILIAKLDHYGIRGNINSWLIASFLTNCKQTIEINGHLSDIETTLCGVPQVSILGPLLFLIYINDIHKSSNKSQFYLFDDDTNLLFSYKNLHTLK